MFRRLLLVSLTEANSYYAGLPSCPVLVARSSLSPWKCPSGLEAYVVRKQLKAVGNHAVKEVWEDNLAVKIHDLLNSMGVMWTSTDVVRIGVAGDSAGSVVVWIGVMPGSLSSDEGLVVAHRCKELIIEYGITDVDVEIRESVVTRSAKFLKPSYSNYDGAVDVRNPLTTTLGLPICAQSTPWAEGTGGFFMSEGGDSNRLFLVTARHVVYDNDNNDKFEHTEDGQHRHNVILLGDAAYNRFVDSIQRKIRIQAYMVEDRQDDLTELERIEGQVTEENKLKSAQTALANAEKELEDLNAFYQDVQTHWATADSRILGHVIFSPPIDVVDQYTEDFAIIEVDASKVDASNFRGNVIDLGPKFSDLLFTSTLGPSFTHPYDRLLRLVGTISDEEMRHPTMLDRNGDQALIVIKRGNATDLTIGRANDICSYTRWDVNDPQTSKQWAILPFDKKSRPFSARGDSGSVIADIRGRVGGLITGGAGSSESLDITYATPISFLLKRIYAYGFHDASTVDPRPKYYESLF